MTESGGLGVDPFTVQPLLPDHKRLRPLVPILIEAMERHGHLHLAPEVRTGLLGMSAATIDRALRDVRERRRPGRTLPRSRSMPRGWI